MNIFVVRSAVAEEPKKLIDMVNKRVDDSGLKNTFIARGAVDARRIMIGSRFSSFSEYIESRNRLVEGLDSGEISEETMGKADWDHQIMINGIATNDPENSTDGKIKYIHYATAIVNDDPGQILTTSSLSQMIEKIGKENLDKGVRITIGVPLTGHNLNSIVVARGYTSEEAFEENIAWKPNPNVMVEQGMFTAKRSNWAGTLFTVERGFGS